jgi:antitoxin HicB
MKKKKKQNNFKYEVDIQWSPEDNMYVANIPELPGCMTHGETLLIAASNAEEAIATYIESLMTKKQAVPVPLAEQNFSGKFHLRMGKSLHRDATLKAQRTKTSINDLLVAAVKKEIYG